MINNRQQQLMRYGEGLDPKAIGMRLDSSIRTKRAADSVQQGNTDALNQEIAGQIMLASRSDWVSRGQSDEPVCRCRCSQS
jgi:hypothetical protein